MNRFVPIFFVIAVFVLGNGQLGFAQIQILDGDGQQVTPNQIPADKVDQPETDQALQIDPQIFGGNGGSSIIIRKSFSSIDENGDLKTENSGKAIVIGPDGERQEFDLNDDQGIDLKFGPMTIEGLVPGPAPDGQAQSFQLGLQSKPVPPAVASQLNLESGLMVSQVQSESSAAAAGIQEFDVLLYADDKQLIRNEDLSLAVKSAGEADAHILLSLIRGGEEMSIAVKPEKRLAGPLKPNPLNGAPDLNLPGFETDDLFGDNIEARMRQEMEEMQEHVRRIQDQLGNGLIEMPLLPERRLK